MTIMKSQRLIVANILLSFCSAALTIPSALWKRSSILHSCGEDNASNEGVDVHFSLHVKRIMSVLSNEQFFVTSNG